MTNTSSISIGPFLLFSVFAVLRQIQFCLWWIPWDRGRHNLIPVKLSLHNLFPNYISTLILTFPKSWSRQETKFLISFSSRIGELIAQLPLKTISEFQSESKQLKSCLLEKPFLVACFSNRVYRSVCGIVKVCLKTRLAAKSNFRWNCFLCVFLAFTESLIRNAFTQEVLLETRIWEKLLVQMCFPYIMFS
jgi:hypothetical protein